MKKKITIIILILLAAFQITMLSNFTNKDYFEKDLDTSMIQTDTTEVGSSFIGNKLLNPNIQYSGTASTIPNWSLRWTSNSSSVVNPGTIDQGENAYRGISGQLGFLVIRENDAQNFSTVTYGANLPEGGESSAFTLISQTLNLDVGTTYNFRAELSGIGSGPSSGAIMIYAGTATSGGANQPNTPLRLERQFTVNNNLQVIDALFTPANGTQYTVVLRHYRSTTQNLALRIHSMGFYLQNDYRIQVIAHDIYHDGSETHLKLTTLSEIDNKISELQNALNPNQNYTAEVRTKMQQEYDDIVVKRAALTDHYQRMNDIYEDSSIPSLKSTVTQEQINTFKTGVEGMSDEIHKAYLLEQATRIQDRFDADLQRPAALQSLADKVTEYKTFVRQIPGISEADITRLESEIDTLATDRRALLNTSYTPTTLATALSDARAAIDAISLQNSKDRYPGQANIRRDEVIAQINNLEDVSTSDKDDFRNILNSLAGSFSSFVDTATSGENIKTTYQVYLDSINNTLTDARNNNESNIDASKTTAKNELTSLHENMVTSTINGFSTLTQVEKNNYIAEALEIVNTSNTSIDEATRVVSVNTIKSQAIQALLDKIEEARLANQKAASLAEVRLKASDLIAEIANYENLSTEQKNAFNTRVNDALATAETSITDATTMQQITDSVAAFNTTHTTVTLEAVKINDAAKLDKRVADATTAINALSLASQANKDEAIASITSAAEAGKTKITDSTSKDDANAELLAAETEIDRILALINLKEDMKKELVDLAGPNPSTEVKELLDKALEDIDNATDTESINTITNDAKPNIETQKVVEEKATNTTEIEAYVPTPRSEAIESIVNDGKTRLENATTQEEIDLITSEIKAQLETQRKNEEKTKLEALIETPRSAAMEQLLREETAKIESLTDFSKLESQVTESRTKLLTQLKEELKQKNLSDIGSQPTKELSDMVNAGNTELDSKMTLEDILAYQTDLAQRIQDYKATETTKKDEEKAKIETLVPRPRSESMMNILNEEMAKIDGITDLAELNAQLEATNLRIVNQLRDEMKQENLSDVGTSPSSEMSAIINAGNTELDGKTTIEDLINSQDEIKQRIQVREELENALMMFETYYEAQKAPFTLNVRRTNELTATFNETKALLASGSINLEEARTRVLNKVKELTNLVYSLRNGNFDIYDQNLAYPSTPANTVFASISNSNGINAGTTMDITRAEVTTVLGERLLGKLVPGKLVLPQGYQRTEQQTIDAINKLKFLRMIEASLLNVDGSTLTLFEGVYQVTILIPTEFRQYTNMQVIFETADGIEVLKTSKTEAWLTFETTHFSSFYVMGEEPVESTTEETPVVEENNMNFIIITILASVNLVLLVVVLFTKKK